MRGRTNVVQQIVPTINANISDFIVKQGEEINVGSMVDFETVSGGGFELYDTPAYPGDKYCFPINESKYIVISFDYDSNSKKIYNGYILDYNEGFSKTLEPIEIPNSGKYIFLGNNKFLSLDVVSNYTKDKYDNSHPSSSAIRPYVAWMVKYDFSLVLTIWEINLETMQYNVISTEEKPIGRMTDTNTYYPPYGNFNASGTNNYPSVVHADGGKLRIEEEMIKIENNIVFFCPWISTRDNHKYYCIIFDKTNFTNFYSDTQIETGSESNKEKLYDLFFYNNKILLITSKTKNLYIFVKNELEFNFTVHNIYINVSELSNVCVFLGVNDNFIFMGMDSPIDTNKKYKFYYKKVGYTTLDSDNVFTYYDKVSLMEFNEAIYYFSVNKYQLNKMIVLHRRKGVNERLYVLDVDLENESFILDDNYFVLNKHNSREIRFENIFINENGDLLLCTLENDKVMVMELVYDGLTNSFVGNVEKITYVRNATNLRYIMGVAKTSGNGGDTIQVYVPYLNN